MTKRRRYTVDRSNLNLEQFIHIEDLAMRDQEIEEKFDDANSLFRSAEIKELDQELKQFRNPGKISSERENS